MEQPPVLPLQVPALPPEQRGQLARWYAGHGRDDVAAFLLGKRVTSKGLLFMELLRHSPAPGMRTGAMSQFVWQLNYPDRDPAQYREGSRSPYVVGWRGYWSTNLRSYLEAWGARQHPTKHWYLLEEARLPLVGKLHAEPAATSAFSPVFRLEPSEVAVIPGQRDYAGVRVALGDRVVRWASLQRAAAPGWLQLHIEMKEPRGGGRTPFSSNGVWPISALRQEQHRRIPVVYADSRLSTAALRGRAEGAMQLELTPEAWMRLQVWLDWMESQGLQGMQFFGGLMARLRSRSC